MWLQCRLGYGDHMVSLYLSLHSLFHAKDAEVGIQDALFYMKEAVTGLQGISD